MHFKFLSMLLISSKILNNLPPINCQAMLPTKAEQINLLTNVHELFEEVKQSAKDEQMAMDESMKTDIELMMKRTRFLIETLLELMLLKLTIGSNAVCALDAKERMETIGIQALRLLKECSKTGLHDIANNSQNLTNITDSAVTHGEQFLDKLNRCSEQRGLAVIACYKKIIQHDVLPVKIILSEAIRNHRKAHLKTFKLKGAIDICVDTVMEDLKDELEQALGTGLYCS